MTEPLTPESLAELRRLYEVAFAVAAPENDWEEWTSKAAEAFPALLDAAERDLGVRAPDTLADLLMRRLRDIEAEKDALAAKVELVRAKARAIRAGAERESALSDDDDDDEQIAYSAGEVQACLDIIAVLDATETDHG